MEWQTHTFKISWDTRSSFQTTVDKLKTRFYYFLTLITKKRDISLENGWTISVRLGRKIGRKVTLIQIWNTDWPILVLCGTSTWKSGRICTHSYCSTKKGQETVLSHTLIKKRDITLENGWTVSVRIGRKVTLIQIWNTDWPILVLCGVIRKITWCRLYSTLVVDQVCINPGCLACSRRSIDTLNPRLGMIMVTFFLTISVSIFKSCIKYAIYRQRT